MADDKGSSSLLPTLEELQHWTAILGRAQQLMLEHAAQAATPSSSGIEDLAQAQADIWTRSFEFWQNAVSGYGSEAALKKAEQDKRFSAPEWQSNAFFDLIRQSYVVACDRLMESVDAYPGVDEETRRKLRFGTRAMLDALSPSNFPFTNPLVLQRTIDTGGENLLKGLENILHDLARGQLTHSDPNAFELGRDMAMTPGKVIKRTPLFELIHYAPTTPNVIETPLVIFPPWINRFYILDLNAKKSFIRWVLDQGISIFLVSWKSADESIADTDVEDYVLAQIEAIDTVRTLLTVDSVHVIGYCVAGTTLAATLGYLAARGEETKVKSATFFAAQVDFTSAGDLGLFVGDEQLEFIRQLSTRGFLDGRYMAATFNLLRGRDLIWNYVASNYLLGENAPPFDLLHWNGDTTNLPARWHQSYLTHFYRDNLLIQPGGIVIEGVPIDLARVRTPTYVQASREDHIAPAESVWKITHHLRGPTRFVLAGSGHIAGVINPPAAGKYSYWTNDRKVDTLAEFADGATETRGSWWPDWISWLKQLSSVQVPATGARIPGKGALPPLADAPGDYVRER